MRNAVDYAYNRGCIIIAATGNDGKSTISYPAALTNVLAVGGTGNGTARHANSNYGDGLDVLGSYVWVTTSTSGGYAASSGTSFATPQVAGLAALVWELAPNLSNTQVMDLIRNNTNRADGRWDAETGYGIIDMGKTLAAAQALGSGDSSKPTEPVEEKDTVPPVIALKGAAVIANK